MSGTVCVSVCVSTALMNGFVLHVEIRGQGSEPGCSAALTPHRHTDAFKMASLHLSVKIKKRMLRLKEGGMRNQETTAPDGEM